MKVELAYYVLDIAELRITLEGSEVSNDFIMELVRLLRQRINQEKVDGRKLYDEK